jgi:hypothetical protein
MGRTTLGIPILRVGRSEITTKCFQRNALNIDLPRRSKSESAQDGHGWTPSLYGMLKKKPTDYEGDCKPSSIESGTKDSASKSQSRGVCFEHSLYVPLLVQLF